MIVFEYMYDKMGMLGPQINQLAEERDEVRIILIDYRDLLCDNMTL